jgi:hypothetical protein
MNHHDPLAGVHEALDARRDPLDDPSLCEALAANPQALVEFVALRERLAVLPGLETRPLAPHRARRWPWFAAAGAAAAAVVVGTFFTTRAATPPTPTLAPAPVGRVLAASLQPIRPTLGVVGAASARSVLLARPDARLETFVRWSAP